ncbi:UNVERIFIED_CONTAM: hypothetical protein Sradi_6879900 [Sesamum radiatum]|uniref:Endonuclease/exonuclease/phosphatase domain-containing protein n=1 Tax=Sesamum radiatum TaxID=300843 RepID=A0AAW2JJE8_SESRA
MPAARIQFQHDQGCSVECTWAEQCSSSILSYAVGSHHNLQFLGLLETRVRQIMRRELWEGLVLLADSIIDDPWCVLGDFNVVTDVSEICGRFAESPNAMSEFRECISAAALVHLPFTGCYFSWHNCSDGSRSLWKRLDRVLVNEVWLTQWPLSKYFCALPSTSDHSPLILAGYTHNQIKGMFRFDNFLANQPGFHNAVWSICRHNIHGTQMYAVVKKLKALKPIFRMQRKDMGDLSNNVQLAKRFHGEGSAII